jgi:hypothetical protein
LRSKRCQIHVNITSGNDPNCLPIERLLLLLPNDLIPSIISPFVLVELADAGVDCIEELSLLDDNVEDGTLIYKINRPQYLEVREENTNTFFHNGTKGNNERVEREKKKKN